MRAAVAAGLAALALAVVLARAGAQEPEGPALEARVAALEEEAAALESYVRETQRGQDAVVGWLERSTFIRDRRLARCVRLAAEGREWRAARCARQAVGG